MTTKIEIEGQTITVDDAIGADDKLIRDALAPFFPEVANATISRSEVEGETIVKVVKRAGNKGARKRPDPISILERAPESVNTAIALAWEIKEMQLEGELQAPEDMLCLASEIHDAIDKGLEDDKAVSSTLEFLDSLPPTASKDLIIGF